MSIKIDIIITINPAIKRVNARLKNPENNFTDKPTVINVGKVPRPKNSMTNAPPNTLPEDNAMIRRL